jgi:ABC-type Fe3+-hydroxamate transport system substrate-binding protein
MAARVVSLVPSVSETLVAWGVVPVAVTRFCEQPGLPTVGGTKNPDVDAIVALRPDLVVVDMEENRKEDADALQAAGVALHVTAVRAVTDVVACLAELRAALDLPSDDFAVDAVAPPAGRPARSVWVPIWRRPWMSINADTYGSSLLSACGASNVLAGHPDRYPTVTIDEVRELHPDIVLAPTEPYPWGWRHRPLFADLAPMILLDGKDLFWWGVRTPGALERIGSLLAGIGSDPRT